MTVQTIKIGLLGKVWLVTIEAARNGLVTVMATGAIEFGMQAWCFRHFCSDVRMAGDAFFSGRLEWIAQ